MDKARINELYKAREYRDVREIINEAVNLYPNNIAFKIKEKDEKGNKIYKDLGYLNLDKLFLISDKTKKELSKKYENEQKKEYTLATK